MAACFRSRCDRTKFQFQANNWPNGKLLNSFPDIQCLVVGEEELADEDATLDELGLESGTELGLELLVEGGAKGDSRYKKSTSRFRWKWSKKRTRRLQKKRRKMRQRAR